MLPELAVIAQHAIEYFAFRFSKRAVSYGWHPFCLQASEETLHRTIIPTFTTTAHTLRDLASLDQWPEFPALVVTALV